MHKNKTAAAAVLSLIVVLPLAASIYFYGRVPSEPLAVGSAAPALRAEQVTPGTPLPQSGRRAILFFRPSCEHCRAMLAQIDALRKEHPEWSRQASPLQWELISTGSHAETIAFARDTRLPVFEDIDGASMRAMHGIRVPYLVLVDEHGIVRHRHTGERSLTYNEGILDSFYRYGQVGGSLYSNRK